MTIRLTTFGGLRVLADDGELDRLPGQRLRAALLVYLAVERSASRASLATVFWPERDEEHARQALRQSLYHLRKVLGPHWLESVGHELRVSAHVSTDVGAFSGAVERGDSEAAARLYAGPFLDAANLLDLKSWENWVDGRRTRHAREFRKSCRDWLEARRAAGDLAGALEAARCWAEPDPFDDEAQHRLIEALADVGERADALRQYETYARLLESEGLRLLDDTVALVERVRAEAAPWPEPPTEPVRPAPSADEPDRPDISATAFLPTAPSPRPTRRRRRLPLATAAASALVVLLGAYWLADHDRAAGALESLVAAGAIEQGERIVLADFVGPPADPDLGSVVTDALRFELLGTGVLRVVDSSEARETLKRMQRVVEGPLTPELAREVALRDGVKAVLSGEIAQAGTGYVLTAALRAASSDRTLAAFRETALDADDIIPAIDRLSQQIRRRVGESLQSIEATPRMEQVTTASLDALRIYGEADRAFRRREYHRVIPLLEEALELDPEFAMAWRLLAVTLGNIGSDRAREAESTRRAYDLRHRLTPRERHLAAARYHGMFTRDHDAVIEAYRRVLELDPDDRAALNNLGLVYRDLGELDVAAALLHRAVALPEASVSTYYNFIQTRLAQNRLPEARDAVAAFSHRYAGDPVAAAVQFWVLLFHGDDDAARAYIEPVARDPRRPVRDRAWARDLVARHALWRGRLEEARLHLEEAERTASDAGNRYLTLSWRLRRAHLEAVLGDPDRGVRLLRDGIDNGLVSGIAPPEQQHAMQAFIYGVAGRPELVKSVFSQFDAQVEPEFQAGYQVRNDAAAALAQLARGNAEQAVRILENARAAQPCRYCFADRMGWALREAGRLEEAAQEWENAAAGKDSFDDIGVLLVQRLWTLQQLPALYEELGDTARALHHYRRLTELWDNADPELSPHVHHARSRIAALSRPRPDQRRAPYASND